jgi:hypothetical protein
MNQESLVFANLKKSFSYKFLIDGLAIFAFKKKPNVILGSTIIFTFLFSLVTFSQESLVQDVISSIAEELAENESDPEAASSYYDLLSELSEDPVRINAGDESRLSRLFFLSAFQVRSLNDYVRKSGKIVTIYEIANIPGFDREIVMKMAPFITLSGESNNSNGRPGFRNSLISNFSLKFPRADSASLSEFVRNLVKYRFSSGNISGGLTSEKDPGESFIDRNNSFPDFFSAWFSYSGTGVIRKVIIGDYGACLGMGTAVNTGIRTGLSLTSPVNLTGKNELRPYTSTDENNFFRGVAAQFSMGAFGLNVYLSSSKIDAKIEDGKASLYKTGLHDTPSSLLKKDALRENSSGINLNYRTGNFNLGFTYARSDFSFPLAANDQDPEAIYSFSGNRNAVISVHYSALVNRTILSGEISSDSRGKTAFVQGMTLRLSDRLTTVLLYRRSQPGYTAFHSNSPGSNASGENQEGLLGSFTFEAAKFLFISAGCDLRHYTWMRYRCSAPSLAIRQELRIKYIPSERFMSELVYTDKYSMTDRNESSGITRQDENIVRSIRCVFRYSPLERLSMNSKFDLNGSSPASTSGMMLMQDVRYTFRGIPLTLWFRHCVYNISGWASRVYAWEDDLLYSFSIPALSGTGSRSYVMVSVKLKDLGEFRVKYGITENREAEVKQAYSQEIKMQLRLRF